MAEWVVDRLFGAWIDQCPAVLLISTAAFDMLIEATGDSLIDFPKLVFRITQDDLDNVYLDLNL